MSEPKFTAKDVKETKSYDVDNVAERLIELVDASRSLNTAKDLCRHDDLDFLAPSQERYNRAADKYLEAIYVAMDDYVERKIRYAMSGND